MHLHWDIVEEHFHEAAFLWSQRERALQSADQSLADIAESDEYRLVAHLEGLVHAGPRAAEHLLLPTLRDGVPSEVAVAALALLASRERDWADTVMAALVETTHPEALLSGVALCPSAGIDDSLRALMPTLSPGLQARVLEVLAFRGVDPGGALEPLLATQEPEVLAAALDCARFAGPVTAHALVARGLSEGSAETRDAAISTGCVVGSRDAWRRCRRVVERDEPLPALSLVAMALGGDAKERALLLERLAHREARVDTLWAMGFGATPMLIESLVVALREGVAAAAAPLSFVSGLPLSKLLVLAEADSDELPVPTAGTALLEPIEQWWRDARPGLSEEGRYLNGRLWSLASVLTALKDVPCAWRSELAWDLSVRTRGSVQVETRAWSWAQRTALASALQATQRFQSGPFTRFLSS
ncbi:hypothetical protein [Myxococcus hansupus]|uniref:hypothetical protein n=1 Tax=Pseudomyxococcus hansupus TaxID=1297742 RepID=UPI00027295CA|nr:hypothetical protein [Myxococcus hansupus]